MNDYRVTQIAQTFIDEGEYPPNYDKLYDAVNTAGLEPGIYFDLAYQEIRHESLWKVAVNLADFLWSLRNFCPSDMDIGIRAMYAYGVTNQLDRTTVIGMVRTAINHKIINILDESRNDNE